MKKFLLPLSIIFLSSCGTLNLYRANSSYSSALNMLQEYKGGVMEGVDVRERFIADLQLTVERTRRIIQSGTDDHRVYVMYFESLFLLASASEKRSEEYSEEAKKFAVGALDRFKGTHEESQMCYYLAKGLLGSGHIDLRGYHKVLACVPLALKNELAPAFKRELKDILESIKFLFKKDLKRVGRYPTASLR